MDVKFNRRFVSYTKSLDALAEARERDLSDSSNYEAEDYYHYRDFNKEWTSEESDFIIFLEEDADSSR